MTVGVVGLGLIGGSFARAYKANGDTVYGFDLDKSILEFACLAKVLDGKLDKNNINECDLIIIALYPKATIEYLENNADFINKNAVVCDTCGIKREVCNTCFDIAEKNGFLFFGAHPMAGTHFSGFKHSRANMFKGAPMVIVPPKYDDIELLCKIENLFLPVGFGSFSVTTAKKHDEMIAFTSQMAHLVSNAFIKSPTASLHKGFSAGSYKDLTRVAWLNSSMWAELFLENKDNILFELETYMKNLNKYKVAIENNDFDTLEDLLEEGKMKKQEVDG